MTKFELANFQLGKKIIALLFSQLTKAVRKNQCACRESLTIAMRSVPPVVAGGSVAEVIVFAFSDKTNLIVVLREESSTDPPATAGWY